MSYRKESASMLLAMAVAMNGMDGRALLPTSPMPEPKGPDGHDMYRLMRAADKRKAKAAKRAKANA